MNAPRNEREARAALDPGLLLATGVLMGPYRRARPVTLTWRVRLTRLIRNLWRDR